MKADIGKIIDELSEKWLGKKGVVAISEEEKDGELYIVFYVETPEFKISDYPDEVNGFRVIIRPSKKIVSYDILFERNNQ